MNDSMPDGAGAVPRYPSGYFVETTVNAVHRRLGSSFIGVCVGPDDEHQRDSPPCELVCPQAEGRSDRCLSLLHRIASNVRASAQRFSQGDCHDQRIHSHHSSGIPLEPAEEWPMSSRSVLRSHQFWRGCAVCFSDGSLRYQRELRGLDPGGDRYSERGPNDLRCTRDVRRSDHCQ